MLWLTQPTQTTPTQLDSAYSLSTRRTRIDRYRSKTDVVADHIVTALSWLRLPVLNADNTDILTPMRDYVTYITKAVSRGLTPEQASALADESINTILRAQYTVGILTFNTAVATASARIIKEKLDAEECYSELNVRTMVTSTPNHKIHIYKRTVEDDSAFQRTIYIILNNIDNPNVLFKISAAIMLDRNPFNNEEITKKFAEAWMTGNATNIYNVVTEYYAEFEASKKEREFTKALEVLTNKLSDKRLSGYREDIAEYERRIAQCYADIESMIKTLNMKKSEYLLQLTRDEDNRLKELGQFLKSCKDKLTVIQTEGNTITIVYNTILMYYDASLLEPYFNSTRSNIVTDAPKWIQQLLKDLFLDNKYLLHIESGISINLENNRFNYADPRYYIAAVEQTGIPNPHHRFYNCWGDNEPIIRRAIQNVDYITAITTAFAAMSGINLSDTAVLSKFIQEELEYETYKATNCLEDTETGELISIREYERRYNNASNATN